MLIYFVTYDQLPAGAKDDRLLLPHLHKLGIKAQFVAWDDLSIDWSKADLAIIRSTWDYHLKYAQFQQWLTAVQAQTKLLNPPNVVRWNSHKNYLKDFASQGIRCVDTLWLSYGDKPLLKTLLQHKNWQRFVIKPAVSASAHGTKQFTAQEYEVAQQHLEHYLLQNDMMIQTYLDAFDTQGETSLIFFAGEFSHAVQRQAALNVSDSLSGFNQLTTVPDSAIDFASTVLNHIWENLLYARVDLSIHDHNQHTLLELELIEPSLFLDFHPHAAEQFARAIAKRLS